MPNGQAHLMVNLAAGGTRGRPQCHPAYGNRPGAASLAREHGFTDIDGKLPRALTVADV